MASAQLVVYLLSLFLVFLFTADLVVMVVKERQVSKWAGKEEQVWGEGKSASFK